MSSKENRAYYLSRGLCPRCGGKARVEEGRVLCQDCQKKHDRWQKDSRAQWKEQGRCTRCGRERDTDTVLCAKCRAYMADIRRDNAKVSKERRDKLREKGFCTRCGKTWAEPGHSFCGKCLERHRRETNTPEQKQKADARRRARVEAGLCIDCGKPTKDGKQRCRACVEARRDSTRKYQIMQRIKREALGQMK